MAEVFWGEVSGGLDFEALFAANGYGHLLSCLPSPWSEEWSIASSDWFGPGLRMYLLFRDDAYPQVTQWVQVEFGYAQAYARDALLASDPWDLVWQRYGQLAMTASAFSPPLSPSYVSQLGKSSLKLSCSDTGLVSAFDGGASAGSVQIDAAFWAGHTMIAGYIEPAVCQQRHLQTARQSGSSPFTVYGRQYDYLTPALDWGGTYLSLPGTTTTIHPVVTPPDYEIRYRERTFPYARVVCVETGNPAGGSYPLIWRTGMRSWAWSLPASGDNLKRLASGCEVVTRVSGGDAMAYWRTGPGADWTGVRVGSAAGLPVTDALGELHVVRQGDTYTRYAGGPIEYATAPADHPWPQLAGVRDRADLIAWAGSAGSATGMGLALYDGTLYAVRLAGDDVSIASGLGSRVGYLEQLPDGRWLAGLWGNGQFRSWLSGDGGETWSADRTDTVAKADLGSVVQWRCSSGLELACGWHDGDNAIYLWHRLSAGDAWTGPVTVAGGVSGFAAPYVTQRLDGLFEVGWGLPSGTTRLSADLATWSAP